MSPWNDIDFFSTVGETTGAPLVKEESRDASVVSTVPAVSSAPKVKSIGGYGSSHLLAGEWTWREMRDYVMGQIEKYHGPQVRNPLKEKGIFEGFISRWGQDRAKIIAQAAFDIHHGMWANAPISINRFCKSSDAFFGQKIIDRLAE